MIERGTHNQVARTLKKLPRRTRRNISPQIESPKPGRRFWILGENVTIDRLEISVAAEADGRYIYPQIVTHALAEVGIIRQDKGRGGSPLEQVPLQFDGSNRLEDGRRLLVFGPFGKNILQ